MNINKLFFTFVFSSLSLGALSLELEKGLAYQTVMPTTLDGYKEYYLSHSLPGNSFSYIKNSRSDYSYYTLNRDNIIFDADLVPKTAKSFFVNETIVNKWPLTPWASEPIEPEVLEQYETVRGSFYNLFPGPSHPLGCLNSTPLRYGDIDGDGGNELVLFIGNELLVFSPSAQQVVFALNIRVDDWMTEEETKDHFDYYPSGSDDAFIPYYQSAANGDYATALPGYRGYGKLYTGDFDKNGSSDILVWRKLYRSTTLTSAKGFNKVGDTYYHYEKSPSGEYALKDTAPETIQNWLSTAQLTWSKGFPSLSECPGEEGKLIPEMHDPLLNDPDVLQ